MIKLVHRNTNINLFIIINDFVLMFLAVPNRMTKCNIQLYKLTTSMDEKCRCCCLSSSIGLQCHSYNRSSCKAVKEHEIPFNDDS